MYICLSGLDDKKLRENILKLDNPSLEEIQKSAMSYENMVKQETMLDSRSQNYTRRTFRRQKTFDKRNKSKGRLSQGSERNTYRSVDRHDLRAKSNRRQSRSWSRNRDITCNKCGKKGHVEKYCRSGYTKNSYKYGNKGHATKACKANEVKRRKPITRKNSPAAKSVTRSASSSSRHSSNSKSRERSKSRMIRCGNIETLKSPMVNV